MRSLDRGVGGGGREAASRIQEVGEGVVRPKIKRRPSWRSCTMRATGRDGITRCCDCGRVTAYPKTTPPTESPTP